jgi:hypothetical protein
MLVISVPRFAICASVALFKRIAVDCAGMLVSLRVLEAPKQTIWLDRTYGFT